MATIDTNPETDAEPAANAWEEALIADLRANGGRPSSGPLAGQPLLILWSTGAKSGKRRRSILTYSRDANGDLVVTGSKGGAPTHPAWYFNVEKDPNVTVEACNETFEATAKVETGAERDRLWAQHVEQLPRFAEYPAQTGGRVIPTIRLQRKA
jgi:deazaflavin-dependent oxidoreductase (nitroreductase family)